MQREQKIYRALRRRLLARASALAMRVALRPRGWASGLLAVGLIGAPASALAGEIINLATDAELTIQGGAAYDGSGRSTSGAGDVNGDGIDDLIIGAPFADPNGRYGAGATYVIFGSDQGLPAIIDLASDADLVIQGAAGGANGYVGDLSGSSVRAGDVTGDGIDDLIIGAPNAAPNGRRGAGASYVVFGTDQGLPASIDLANGADLIIQGAQGAEGYASGSQVSAGDVNGDGIDDLLIGAPNASPNGRLFAGATYVLFGATDLSGTIDLADPVNGADLIIQGAGTDDFIGFSMSAAGDVDGDGIDDLIIGEHLAEPSGRPGAGISYVVLGSDRGLPAIIDLASDADLVIQGAAPYDSSGHSVSGAGDVNGDGIDDLIIGAPNADAEGRDDAGASYVVFGTADDFPATIDLAIDADLIIEGSAAHDESGSSVSGAGDVNGDGIGDLIIGAPATTPNRRDRAGESYVVFGATNLAGALDLADPRRGADLTFQGASAYDYSGSWVDGAGDINGDGFDDLIIGAPDASPKGRRFAGESHVVFGGPAAAIERLIARVEAADLPRRLEENLTRKLSKAVDNVTEEKITRAMFRLRAFVDRVKGRQGKNIDQADADVWIANARAIIDMLRPLRQLSPASGHRALSAMVPAP